VKDHVGTCTAVTGVPHGKRVACVTDNQSCAGTCDGTNRATCAYPGTTTKCADSTCADSTEQPFDCDGNGACVPGNPISCGNFACGAKGCNTTCSVDADCALGFICQDSTDGGGKACIPTPEGRCSTDNTRVLDATGKFIKDCSPYFCLNGQCGGQCSASADCQAGYVCDRAAKACKKAAPPPPSPEVGCMCRMAERKQSGRGSALLAALAVAVTTVRRRRRAA
jgi:hypothetical protein